ncbi:MAG: FHA domain-containing protein [Deltaproteobacteria bacterium]|nr:FHA domain-containing protein [Deltaproteobacteria bacterium]
MQAYVRVSLPDGSTAALSPGDLIGRTRGAALTLDDGRISEAHALVSLRGGELKLLALRGRFAVDGRTVRDVTLNEGLVLELAPDLPLLVLEVSLPDEVLALRGDGLPRQVLSGVGSLHLDPEPRLVPRYEPDAAAHIWDTGSGWTLSVAGSPARGIAKGDTFAIGARRFELTTLSLHKAGGGATRAGSGRPPLSIEARFHSVHIHSEGALVLSLSGIAARIVSELVTFDGPVDWFVLAKQIWREEDQRILLRRRWDVALTRLRTKLRDAGLDTGLVAATRTGLVELVLEPQDTVVDRT